MKKNKFIYSLSAIALACIISFSGVGNSYIQVHATSVGFDRPVWNDDATVWENILQHLKLYGAISGLFTNPSAISYSVQSFYDFMLSDGISHDSAHGIFCDCDDETHTSFSGQEHGGGGFVRDGITVDDGGNVTYSDEVCDLFHGYILSCVNSNSGYLLYKTPKVTELNASYFYSPEQRNAFISAVDFFGLCGVTVATQYAYEQDSLFYCPTENFFTYEGQNGLEFVSNSYGTRRLVIKGQKYSYGSPAVEVLEDDWTYHRTYPILLNDNGQYVKEFNFSTQTYDFNDYNIGNSGSLCSLYDETNYSNRDTPLSLSALVSSDGRNVKIWYDLSAFKNYDVGHQMYYVTDSFNTYDSSVDNSTTITSQEFAYYYDNSSTIFQTIQNNINNYGGELDEKTVQDIVDDAIKELLDELKNNNSDGDGDNSDDDGGNGIGSLVDGIGKLLDTILSLIGKVMGVVADFTQSILDLFSGFTDFTDGFSSFLSGAFSFIPQEIWNVIQVGLSLMILLAVIKFLRK